MAHGPTTQHAAVCPPIGGLVGRRAIQLIIFVMIGLGFAPGWVAAEAERPAYQTLRYEEDWSVLRDPALRTDILDPIKYIALDPMGQAWLSFGGEIRERYEYTRNPVFGDDPQDRHGVFLQRYVLHGDLHVSSSIRTFMQLSSALENGRAGDSNTLDENEFDLQQAFFDLRLPLREAAALTLRAGRQELRYGSARLIDVREGPNVRRKFDGARGIFDVQGWRVDAFAVQPTVLKTGIIDDRLDDRQQLWGVYAIGRPGWLPAGSLDLYYLGFRDKSASYDQGQADEHRHSLGARWAGEGGGWDWNVEAVYQFGAFGDGEIRAWTIASVTGYRFPNVVLQPRFALGADVASGDKDPNDRDLETFNPLFPRGNYFSELALLGPRNFFDLHPSVTLVPHRDVSLVADWNLFWRLSRDDGIYTPGGRLLRPAGGSDSRFVGHAPGVALEWQATRHVAVSAIYTHFFPGRFIKDTGPSADIDFIELTLKVQF